MVFAMTIMILILRLTLLAIYGFVTYGDMFGSIVKESVTVFFLVLSYLIILVEQTNQGFLRFRLS